jgi:hypothetical protein
LRDGSGRILAEDIEVARFPAMDITVPRDGERALARFGLPGEGAEPVFTPGAARRKLHDAKAAAKDIPAKIPLREYNPDMVRLDAETKLITHAIRMAACNTATTLARALDGIYARTDDEAHAVIREALTASGDIIPGDGTLTIRLDPLSAPRRTRALAALSDQLTATRTRYPGTKLTLRYEVKEQPGSTA